MYVKRSTLLDVNVTRVQRLAPGAQVLQSGDYPSLRALLLSVQCDGTVRMQCDCTSTRHCKEGAVVAHHVALSHVEAALHLGSQLAV